MSQVSKASLFPYQSWTHPSLAGVLTALVTLIRELRKMLQELKDSSNSSCILALAAGATRPKGGRNEIIESVPSVVERRCSGLGQSSTQLLFLGSKLAALTSWALYAKSKQRGRASLWF